VNKCDQCGFAYEQLDPTAVAAWLRAAPEHYRQAVSGATAEAVRKRPEPAVWSALEYVCHVRDVLLVQRDRAVVALVEARPSFPRMHRDERVALCGYAEQAMAEVLAQLEMAAELCAMVFEGLDGPALSRPIRYSFPEPADRDLAWLGRHTVHEVEHHLQDVAAVLERLGAS
jgi:S-DNA-T family DNA segregation ATPase FtsK/SpoIIIE